MALKFLNKKGWHTGSLRNIENVWKAEQKHDAEEKKLDELRKQIHEERERAEFRLLQEQAGLVPRQERLDFLYDSGLAVGKGSSDGFKALETLPKSNSEAVASSSSDKKQQQQPSAPGALFEEKPQSANDAWRKLHSDPLLLIRQREQEALARVKNNPVQMAMIRKSVEAKKHKEKPSDSKEKHHHHHHRKKKSKHHRKHSSPPEQEEEEDVDSKKGSGEVRERQTSSSHKSLMHDDEDIKGAGPEDLGERSGSRRRRDSYSEPNGEQSEDDQDRNRRRNHDKSKHERYHTEEGRINHDEYNNTRRGRERERESPDVAASRNDFHRQRRLSPDVASRNDLHQRRQMNDRHDRSDRHGRPSRNSPDGYSSRKSPDDRPTRASPDRSDRPSRKSPDVALHNTVNQKRQHRSDGRPPRKQLTEEERAARLREMQMDAELHEEQRWKRIKKAEDEDAHEASRAGTTTSGKNFLDAAHRSVYGADKGGSSTIEESVRRRTHYSQGKSEASEHNAFRR